MLVLKRKERETVVIPLPEGGEITIVVGRCRSGNVSLGFDAPKEITILRSELPRHSEEPVAA